MEVAPELVAPYAGAFMKAFGDASPTALGRGANLCNPVGIWHPVEKVHENT